MSMLFDSWFGGDPDLVMDEVDRRIDVLNAGGRAYSEFSDEWMAVGDLVDYLHGLYLQDGEDWTVPQQSRYIMWCALS